MRVSLLAAAALYLGAAAPARVVSLNLCTDQYLLMLAPEKIAALSPLARDPSLSFYAAEARRHPAVRPDAEAVLRLRPDLVVTGPYETSGLLALLRARHVPVETVTDARTIESIAEILENLGHVLGEPERGREAAARLAAALGSVPKTKHGSALLLEPRGWTASDATLAGDVLRQAGWHSIGTGTQLDLETVLTRRRPDLLVTEATPRTPSLATDWLRHPALAALARRTVDGRALLCGLPQTADLAAALAR